jgi:hypothetical protein
MAPAASGIVAVATAVVWTSTFSATVKSEMRLHLALKGRDRNVRNPGAKKRRAEELNAKVKALGAADDEKRADRSLPLSNSESAESQYRRLQAAHCYPARLEPKVHI